MQNVSISDIFSHFIGPPTNIFGQSNWQHGPHLQQGMCDFVIYHIYRIDDEVWIVEIRVCIIVVSVLFILVLI